MVGHGRTQWVDECARGFILQAAASAERRWSSVLWVVNCLVKMGQKEWKLMLVPSSSI